MRLLRSEKLALDELVAWVRGRFGARLAELRLFGSRARGEGSEDSDVDVLIVIDGLTWLEGRELTDQTGDLLTRHDVLISPFAMSLARWTELRDLERRIVREIERDGIAL